MGDLRAKQALGLTFGSWAPMEKAECEGDGGAILVLGTRRQEDAKNSLPPIPPRLGEGHYRTTEGRMHQRKTPVVSLWPSRMQA